MACSSVSKKSQSSGVWIDMGLVVVRDCESSLVVAAIRSDEEGKYITLRAGIRGIKRVVWNSVELCVE